MRYRICTVCKEMYEVNNPCHEEKETKTKSHFVMGEIEPYKCMISGEMITSRRKHRNNLRKHGCIEAGNEFKAMTRGKLGNKPGDI